MGALPPGIEGKLGMEIASASSSPLDSLLLFKLILLFLSLSRRCFCLSLSLALKGLGLFSPMGLITTEGFSVSATDSVEDWIGKELTDEGEIDEKPSEDDPELNLLARLNRLELARKPGLELLPNDGVGWGAELAGVAIRVGFTLVLVLVATVVLTLSLLGLKILFLFLLSRLRAGLITGVKVLPGRPRDTRWRDLVGLTVLSSASSLSSSSSSPEVRVRSLSRSSKLLVGVMVLSEVGVAMVDTEMTLTPGSPDWISGTLVDTGPEVERMVSTRVWSPSYLVVR